MKIEGLWPFIRYTFNENGLEYVMKAVLFGYRFELEPKGGSGNK
jgi:hypothetical protein